MAASYHGRMKVRDMFRSLPTLETDRLILRKTGVEDAADMFEYASDEAVADPLMWDVHQSIQDSRGFLASTGEMSHRGEPTGWGVVHRATDKLIGTSGFISWDERHNRAEVGYALSRKFWGQGLMTEAVIKIISLGFEEMSLHRIDAMCDVPNIGSARVMEKSGMTFEGILRDYMYRKGEFRDVKIYSILRDEYDRQAPSG